MLGSRMAGEDKVKASRRQIALFLAAIVAPSLVVGALILRLLEQDRELAQRRHRDEHRIAVERIGQELLKRLEHLKLEAVTGNSRNPAVAFAAWVRDGRLVLPWEAGASGAVLRAPYFEPHVRAGERAEFVEGRPADAVREYSAAVRAARVPAQAWYARLLRARAMDKAERAEESTTEWRALLSAPGELADEEGVPLRLHAAERLAGTESERGRVLDTARAVMDRGWLPPAGAYMLSTIAEKLGTMRREVAARIRDSGQAAALQADFPRLNIKPRGEPAWLLYGSSPWLVSGAPPDRVVVVRAAGELRRFETRGVRFAGANEPRGELLGTAFPNLKAEAPVAPGDDGRLRRRMYYATLLFVACAALFVAWMLWRDLRREMRLAALHGQFVANVSHELKTPLTAIRMFAETLQMGRSRDPEMEAEYLATIVNECERLTRLVEGVLQFSRLEQGKRIFHMRQTQLARVAWAAARAMQYPLGQKGIELNVEIEEDLPPVKADPDAIEQTMLNLLSNAIKYSGEGRRIEMRVRRHGGHAVIEVQDFGLGIPREEQGRIFEKFYRVPGKENQAIPGTGLGLTLVSQIARAHGGGVEVASEPGLGSTFTVRLPLNREAI